MLEAHLKRKKKSSAKTTPQKINLKENTPHQVK